MGRGLRLCHEWRCRPAAVGPAGSAALGQANRFDELALSHAAGSAYAEAAGELLEFGEDHPVESASTATSGPIRDVVGGGLGRLARDSGQFSICHSGSFLGPAPTKKAGAWDAPRQEPRMRVCTRRCGLSVPLGTARPYVVRCEVHSVLRRDEPASGEWLPARKASVRSRE